MDGQEPAPDELKRALRNATLARKIFPILYGSSTRQIGIDRLLDAVRDYLPSPVDEGETEGKHPANDDVETRKHDLNAPFSAYVFKTISDPFAGKLSVMRVVSGRLGADGACYNSTKQSREKIGHMFRLEGKKQEGVERSRRSAISSPRPNSRTVTTGDTLCDEKAPIQFDGPAHFSPVISFALEPKTKADEEKVPQGLHRMMEEDPTIDAAPRRGNARLYSVRHGPAAYRDHRREAEAQI